MRAGLFFRDTESLNGLSSDLSQKQGNSHASIEKGNIELWRSQPRTVSRMLVGRRQPSE